MFDRILNTTLQLNEKQPPEVFFKKRCFSKIFKIHRKAPVSESASLLKKRVWRWCFPVNFFKISKNTFFQRTPLGDCFC